MNNQSPGTEHAPFVSVPPPEKPKNWFKILLIIVGLLVIFGLFGNLYLLLRKENQNPPVSKITPTQAQAVLLPTPTPDGTANWKTYTNKEYKFTLSYNQEFSFQIQDEKVTDEPKVFLRFSHNKIQFYPVIDLVLVKTNLTLEEWMKKLDYCPANFNSCTNPVEGPLSGSIQFDKINRHYAGITTLIKNNGILFEFGLGATDPNKPIEESVRNVYNQILSTFKFLPSASSGQEDQITEWKTYTNTKDGYSIKYPRTWFDRKGYEAVGIDSEHYFSNEDVKYDDLASEGVYLFVKKYNDEITKNDPSFYFNQDKDYPGAEIITVDGQPAVKTQIKIFNVMEKGDKERYFNKVSIVFNNKIYYQITLESWFNQAVKSNEPIFNQILSTFKFLL